MRRENSRKKTDNENAAFEKAKAVSFSKAERNENQMNTAEYVGNLITTLKSQGVPLSEVAWRAALACVKWAYVFGARGEYCTPSNRRSRDYVNHPTIKSACKNFDGNGSCSGCKWLPEGKKTRFFDCRGFTYRILLQVYGWKLMGAGATSQWNNADNWKAKGEIATMPANTLVCLFVKKGNTMEHTGFGLNDETVECSSGVQHFTKRNKKWTHWGIPACIDGEIPTPIPVPPTPDTKPTLKRGSKGAYVIELQTDLVKLGYDVGSYGVDGDFGSGTEAAVKKFQTDKGLKVDGIVGSATWAALDESDKGDKTVYPATVVAKSGGTVRLRISPSTSAKVVAQIPVGTQAKVYDKQPEWCYLEADGYAGFMMTEFLNFDGDTPTPEKYTVIIPALTEAQADELISKYPGATKSVG